MVHHCTMVRRRRSWDELRRTYHGAPFATKSKYKNVNINTNTNTHKFIWAHTNVYKYEYKYTHLIHAKPTRLNLSGGWWWQRWWQLSPGTRVRRQSCRDRGAHRAVLALSRYLPSCWNTVPSGAQLEQWWAPGSSLLLQRTKSFRPNSGRGSSRPRLSCVRSEVGLFSRSPLLSWSFAVMVEWGWSAFELRYWATSYQRVGPAGPRWTS